MLVCCIICCQNYAQIYYKKLKCIKTDGNIQNMCGAPRSWEKWKQACRCRGESEPWEPPVCLQSALTIPGPPLVAPARSSVWSYADPSPPPEHAPCGKRDPVRSARCTSLCFPSWLVQSHECCSWRWARSWGAGKRQDAPGRCAAVWSVGTTPARQGMQCEDHCQGKETCEGVAAAAQARKLCAPCGIIPFYLALGVCSGLP